MSAYDVASNIRPALLAGDVEANLTALKVAGLKVWPGLLLMLTPNSSV
jgi:hypothetical protein